MSDVYDSISQGLREALDHAQGKRTLRTARLSTVAPPREFKAEEIKSIRNTLGMTQAFFADFMGVSPKTVEAWESGRNIPEGPARRILSVVQVDPAFPERYHILEPRQVQD
ncbi:MAG: helix-turn-helix domain-containing protein [Oscillospiraceae bacterium]|jgi:putative transcriptional regulator|nr:helix-turn-helix domain-containing protein [Oscillospiraceae bacterium]